VSGPYPDERRAAGAAVDLLSPERRSENMRRIKSKGTTPEMAVRRLVHGMGYRFRLHRNDLPGRPDLVFPSRRKVIFVHGCFWHGHDDPNCAVGRRQPKSNLDYWLPKLSRNKARDADNSAALTRLGWSVITIWECKIKQRDKSMLTKTLYNFLKIDS
jgi:DNA mismatch endonuclease (patch repair protein)